MALKTFGTIYFDAERSRWMMTDVTPHVAMRIKNIFKGIPVYAVVFSFPDTPEMALDLEWFMQRYPMDISKKDREYLEKVKIIRLEDLASMERIALPEYIGQTFKLNGELRHYQSRFVELFLKSKRILLADDVGLGKTAQAIGAFTQPRTLPAAVVVQTHLPVQWREEISKFLPNANVHIIKGTQPYHLPMAEIYIFKYSCLAGWSSYFIQRIFKTAIFDEVQELRRSESQKYQGAKVLSSSVEYCAGLSATPIYNYGGEIFCVMDVIKDGCLGQEEEFLREWCIGEKHRVAAPKALGAFLRDNFLMVRRDRKMVGRELPEVNTVVHTVDTDEKAIANIEQLAKALAMKVTSGSSSFIEKGEAARELDLLLRQATGVGKARYVADYVKILLDNGESVLLAGWHRAVYDIWNRELAEYKPLMYTGSESPAQKENSKKSFMAGESNLMFISLRSGVGLDGLQKRCSIVVFGELDWSPKVHEQVIGRLNRDGQTDQVTSIYLISDDGSDPVIVDMLGLKASQSKDILDPDSAVTSQKTDESRVKILAERFLEKRWKPGQSGELLLEGQTCGKN